MLIFYVLMFFILVGAIIAVETKDLLSAVICVGAAGFGGSVMFLFLRAPDVAITQIVVEVLALVILIRSTIARDKTFISGDREFFGMVVSVVVVFVIFLGGISVFRTLPDFGNAAFTEAKGSDIIASKEYITESLEKTGAANIVSAIILDFRAYDTLGEATVLFTSIIGAVVILRKKSRSSMEVRQ